MKHLIIVFAACIATIQAISYGYLAETGQFPWQVNLVNHYPSGREIYYCGGALISQQWILTTDFCVKPFASWTVRMGSVIREKPTIVMRATHGESNGKLGLIKLPEPVQFSSYLYSIRLPGRSLATRQLQGRIATVSGFGATAIDAGMSDDLYWTNMTIISSRSCGGDNSVLCAKGFQNDAQNVCEGDSGSPLFIYSMGYPVQVGVQSFGSRYNCSDGSPGGFTNVAVIQQLDWISEISNIKINP